MASLTVRTSSEPVMNNFQLGVLVIAAVVISGGYASPVEHQDLRVRCKAGKEPFACIKFRALQAIDTLNAQSSYQLTDSITIVKNEEVKPTETDGSGDDLEDAIESLVDSHDVRVDLPEMVGGGSLTVSPRDLDEGKVTVKFDDARDNMIEPKSRRRNKLRKLIVPLMVFVLLKAMTLIPLALGVLGLKAWNALQLSFFSFVTSLALAIFQLCKKVAGESAPMPVAAHTAWEPHYYAARNLLVGSEPEVDPTQIAYSAYAK